MPCCLKHDALNVTAGGTCTHRYGAEGEKVAAARAAGKKADKLVGSAKLENAREAVGNMHEKREETRGQKPGSTPRERYRQVDDHCHSRFFRTAAMFGIEGSDPQMQNFIHPEIVSQQHPEMCNDDIFVAMTAAILDVLESQHKREMGLLPGSIQRWVDACENMRVCALHRLKHKRQQRNRRNKIKEKKQQQRERKSVSAIVDALD